MKLYFTSQSQDPLRLDLFLKKKGFSTALIRSMKFNDPGLLINGARARTNMPVSFGDSVCACLPKDDESAMLLPEKAGLDVLYASGHSFVVNKPAGIAMHPVMSYKNGTLGNFFMGWLLESGLEPRAFRAIGRLDVGTSGLVLCAMNAYSAVTLAGSFKKKYYAIINGVPKEKTGRLEFPIAPCEDSIIKQMILKNGKNSITNYKIIAHNNDISLAEIHLETGRTHQIRLHFSHIGYPLVGDTLYGRPSKNIARQALHCGGLEFYEPESGVKSFFAPLPDDMCGVLEKENIDFTAIKHSATE